MRDDLFAMSCHWIMNSRKWLPQYVSQFETLEGGKQNMDVTSGAFFFNLLCDANLFSWSQPAAIHYSFVLNVQRGHCDGLTVSRNWTRYVHMLEWKISMLTLTTKIARPTILYKNVMRTYHFTVNFWLRTMHNKLLSNFTECWVEASAHFTPSII